jgi:hypothetical protein
MHKVSIIVGIILLAALISIPTAAFASSELKVQDTCLPQVGQQDSVIFGNDCTLSSGQGIAGSLVVFGGNVTIEAEAMIGEDLVVFGGNVDMDGILQGDVFILGGNIDLGPNAVVNGNVVSPGGNINRDPSAVINGDQVSNIGPFFTDGFDFSWGTWTASTVLWMIFQALAMSAVAVLIALFVPGHLKRTTGAVVKKPFESWGLGLLTLILLVVAIPVSILTCIGPFILIFLLVCALALGWVAMGYELGRRMAQAFNQNWTIVLEAWVGTLSLGVIVSLIGIVPCVGWVVPIIVGALGLGAVLLTRFGTIGELMISGPQKSPRKTSSKK